MASSTTDSPTAEHRSEAAFASAGRVARAALRLGLVALILLPVCGFFRVGSAPSARLAVLGIFCVTLVRAGDGLLLCAAFLPFAGFLGGFLGFQASIREPLLLSFLAAWVVRDTVRRRHPVDAASRAIVVPALLFAAVVATSMLVQLMVQQVLVNYPWPFVRDLIAHVGGRYVLGNSYPGLAPGAAMLEGVGMFVAAVVLCRRHPLLGGQTTAMAVVGGTAVAALSLYRLAEICLRYPGLFRTLLVHPRNIRISPVFPDVNAAASYLAMLLLMTVGLAVAARSARWVWGGVALVIVAAAWFNGSRALPPAVALAGVLGFAWVSRHKWHRRFRALLAAIAIIFVALVLVDWLVAGYATQADMRRAFVDRFEFSLAALRAWADHPAFGVGIGQLWSVSGNYILSAEVRQFATQENAHNNFLQILAELGLVGFVCFMWLLVVLARQVSTALRTRGDATLAGVAGGLLAFLLTCLVGHPLLTPDVTLAFWLMLGVAAALALDGVPAADPGSRREVVVGIAPAVMPGAWRRWVCAGAVACLIVSVPIRAHQFVRNEADLGLAAIGFASRWSFDDGGIRYREMTGRAEFYVGAHACDVRIGLRVDPGETRSTADVELRIDGRPVKRVRAVRDSWREARLTLIVDKGKRFRKIELRTVPDADVTLRTGRPAVADCGAPGPRLDR
jgi:O-antigen ligase